MILLQIPLGTLQTAAISCSGFTNYKVMGSMFVLKEIEYVNF